MLQLFQNPDIRRACQAYHVRELYVFGSVAEGNEHAGSDVDLLVEFERSGYVGAFDQLMDFKAQMESLLGRPVDIIVRRPFRNPYLQQEVDRSKRLVYAA